MQMSSSEYNPGPSTRSFLQNDVEFPNVETALEAWWCTWKQFFKKYLKTILKKVSRTYNNNSN